MDKYISREAAVDAGYLSDWYISSVGDEPPVWTDAHIDELLNDFIVIPKDTKVADVQPVNQWISVNDRLPEIGRSVLVAVNINAKLNLPFCTDSTPEIRIGWLDDNGKWGLQFDSADRDEILYWQLLPELPQD